ncbi:hypothetical protein ACX12E_16015 [Paenibacillus vandeheii]
MNQLDWVYRSYHQSRSRVGGEWEESVLFLLQQLNVMDQQSDGEHEREETALGRVTSIKTCGEDDVLD